jgi:GxxExxY protein
MSRLWRLSRLIRALFSSGSLMLRPATRGRDFDLGFRADIVVDGHLLIELKAVDDLAPSHLAQTMTYLRLLELKRGLLLNFNKRLLKEGIKRVAI